MPIRKLCTQVEASTWKVETIDSKTCHIALTVGFRRAAILTSPIASMVKTVWWSMRTKIRAWSAAIKLRTCSWGPRRQLDNSNRANNNSKWKSKTWTTSLQISRSREPPVEHFKPRTKDTPITSQWLRCHSSRPRAAGTDMARSISAQLTAWLRLRSPRRNCRCTKSIRVWTWGCPTSRTNLRPSTRAAAFHSPLVLSSETRRRSTGWSKSEMELAGLDSLQSSPSKVWYQK